MTAVTAVITTYNLEKYIAGCLEDLMNQTMRDFQVLVIDDASRDKTPEIAEGFAARFPCQIKVLILPYNLGSAARTRNFALDSGLISGTYVVFLDGDDRLAPDFLESLYWAACHHKADMAVCAFDRIHTDTGKVLCRELRWLPDGGTLASGDPALAFLNGAVWNKLIRTQIIGQSRIPEIKIGEDISFALSIYPRCNKIACVSRFLIHYQVHPASAMTGTGQEDIIHFAEELALRFRQAPLGSREMPALAAYLHIALSMSLRAAHCQEISLKQHNRWLRQYCQECFDDFGDIVPASLLRLSGSKLKGTALWLSLFLYKKGWLMPAVRAMNLYTKITGKDIKW